MDGLLGVAGMIITSDYSSFPHSLRSSTSKMMMANNNNVLIMIITLKSILFLYANHDMYVH